MSYYAVYKDDTLITHGTTLEIAEVLGVNIASVYSAVSRGHGNDRPGKQLFIKVEEDNS